MSTINGLPAHVLLVHGVVVLVPLTALLLALSALVPAVRRRLVWLVVALAAVTVVLTPVTTRAGEALAQRYPEPAEALNTHMELGRVMIYFVVPLLVVSLLLAFAHVREVRGRPPGRGLTVALAVLAVVVATAATVHCVRVGDSGARAVWGVQAAASIGA
ncbi:DUF2231 domain-containing protein [Microbacterium aurum]